jgi:hypothetical protein
MITCGKCNNEAHSLTRYYEDETNSTVIYCKCGNKYPDKIDITFGKHANKSLEEILDNDPQYLYWASKNLRNETIKNKINIFLTPYRIIWD